jgi:hypothetical protein
MYNICKVEANAGLQDYEYEDRTDETAEYAEERQLNGEKIWRSLEILFAVELPFLNVMSETYRTSIVKR